MRRPALLIIIIGSLLLGFMPVIIVDGPSTYRKVKATFDAALAPAPDRCFRYTIGFTMRDYTVANEVTMSNGFVTWKDVSTGDIHSRGGDVAVTDYGVDGYCTARFSGGVQ